MTQIKLRILRGRNPAIINLDYRERKIIRGALDTQYLKTFKKTKEEKLRLKIEKAREKLLHTSG